MKINVVVSNLEAYREGRPTGQWTELPVDDVQKEILDKVEGNVDDEFFISDYMAPFKIDEHALLWELNELAKALQPFDSIEDVYFALDDKEYTSIGEVREFDEYFFETFFADDPMEAARAAYFGNIKSWMDDYIYINGYGNLESMSEYEFKEELEKCADEIIEQFAKENEIALD